MSSSDSTSETLDSSDAVLDLGALVAASRDLARRSGEIVRGIYESGDLQVIDKALGKSVLSKSDSLKAQDPTTLADVTAERLIIGSIKKQFPGLRVCGEEGETKISDDEICVPNMVFDKDKQVPNQYDKIKVKDCCVWVDPIDGTKEYTEGIKEAVTTLIGIAHKGRPIAGVIGRPFTGEIIWGIVGLGAYGYNKKGLSNRDKTRRIICTTRSHFKPSMKSYIAACNPTGFVRAGGSGGKVLMVIEGIADAYVFPSLGTKKWDTCAPEAILMSLGGFLTKPDGNVYDYDSNEVEAMNSQGFIATVFDQEYHESFLEANLTIEQLDLTICGATGFTGKLAAQYICEKYLTPSDNNHNNNNTGGGGGKNGGKMQPKYGLAGRNMKKLEKLRSELCKINVNAEYEFKLIEYDSLNLLDCEKVARLSTVVLTCVGPYARYGENLISSCCKYGVDYVDLTGEYPWVKEMIKKYESEAIRSSARIVNFGGLVSSIPDCGVYSIVNYMQEKLGVQKGEALNIRYISTIPSKSSMSGGTTESYFNSLSSASKYDMNDCYFLKASNKDYGASQPKLSLMPEYFEEWSRYSIPWIYGAIDRMVICRSNGLLNFEYGKESIFYHGVMLIQSFFVAWFITLMSAFIKVSLKYKIVQFIFNLFRSFFPSPGDGPSMDDMLKSRVSIYIDGETMNDENEKKKKARLNIKMFGDAGYYLTSRILVEEGMIFLNERKDKKRRKIKGGMLTPAVAFGDKLFQRLNQLKQFDIKYQTQSKL